MNSFDVSVLRLFNSLAGRSHGFDLAVAAFTNDSPLLFAVLFAGYFFLGSGATLRMRRTVLLAGLSGAVAIAVAVVIAAVFYRARPFMAMPGEVRMLIQHANDSSFPSDHATGSAAFAAGMWRAPGRTARWVFAALAVAVGLSRLVAGVHWPTDILGSLLLGALCAQAVFALGQPLAPILDWVISRVEQVQGYLRGRGQAS